MGRINPWDAIREICVVLSTGNKSGAFALVRGVEGVATVDTSGTLDRVCELN
jgi:hypothetical protein